MNLNWVEKGDVNFHWSSPDSERELGRRRHSICNVRVSDVIKRWCCYEVIVTPSEDTIGSAIDAYNDILIIVLE
jgi:hypothetical protein